jgi:hypothetical protein
VPFGWMTNRIVDKHLFTVDGIDVMGDNKALLRAQTNQIVYFDLIVLARLSLETCATEGMMGAPGNVLGASA